jgi:predicted RecB family endonuclease
LREEKITARVENYLSGEGFMIKREVPALTKRIDIVGIRDGEVWTVEAKVSDWRRALQQANQNRIFGERPYVALWHRHLKNIEERLFDRFGIGIMSVNGDVEIVRPAKKSKVVHSSLAGSLKRYVRGNG